MSDVETATVLETHQDAIEAKPGLYVVHSGSAAYFPVMGFIEEGHAKVLGEFYDNRGRLVTVRVTSQPGVRVQNPEPTKHMISIGPEFFITALKDYNDWPIKWWREAVQNAVDAGGMNIHLGSVKHEDGTVTVFCDDDGSGMDEDTILNKFLVLGATTKIGASGAAGGFGKAKELLLLPWIAWRIHSRDTLIQGAGIDYTLIRTAFRQGTRLEVVMPPDKTTDGAIALGFLQKCYLPNVNFTVNGVPARADLAGGNVIDSVPDKAEIYFIPANEQQSYLYVRARGLFMFSSYVGGVPGFLIAELLAPSIDILTANRDGFRDRTVGYAIDRLAECIAKDNMSALRAGKGLIRQKFEGTGKFKARDRAAMLLERIGPYHSGPLSVSDANNIVATVGDYARQEEMTARREAVTSLPSTSVATAMLDQKFSGPNHLEAAIKQLVWEPDFYLMNDVDGWYVPKKFFPETMTPTVLKLAKVWAELCRYVLMQLGSDRRFGIGFIFSEVVAAAAVEEEDSRSGRVEPWLMLNPYKDMSRRSTEMWRTTDADLKWLYAAAIHEATHIADRISYHDESFAAALTRNMAKCADGYRKIKQIATGIRMRGGPELD